MLHSIVTTCSLQVFGFENENKSGSNIADKAGEERKEEVKKCKKSKDGKNIIKTFSSSR